jgi:hypothetical protein
MARTKKVADINEAAVREDLRELSRPGGQRGGAVMRIHETDPTIAAKNREQGAWCNLAGGMIFAVAIVVMCLGGRDVWPLAVVGLVLGCLGRTVVDSNRGR